MAVLVVHPTAVFSIPLNRQRHVPSAAQRILRAGRLHGSEFVPKAQVDVVQEPMHVRAMVLSRVEGLHDVFLASFSVLGRGRQVSQVD